MKKKVKKNSKEAMEVKLTSALTINTTSDTYKVLSEALYSAKDVTIIHSGISEVDLSYLQILLSLRNYADESGKKITLIADDKQILDDLYKKAGCPEYKRLVIQQLNNNQ